MDFGNHPSFRTAAIEHSVFNLKIKKINLIIFRPHFLAVGNSFCRKITHLATIPNHGSVENAECKKLAFLAKICKKINKFFQNIFRPWLNEISAK